MPLTRQVITLSAPSVPISQTDQPYDSIVPGYAFRIVGVQHFAESITAAVDYNVTVGGRAAVDDQVPVEDVRGDATLGVAANLAGSSTEAIVLESTTDGSGLAVGLKVHVTIEPQGLRGT